MNEKKIYSWLGLAMRSGNLVSGDDTTLRDLKKMRLSLIILADDASANTKKLFTDKSCYRNIAFRQFGTKEELGRSIGKSPRAVLGIKDKKMSDQILILLDGTEI